MGGREGGKGVKGGERGLGKGELGVKGWEMAFISTLLTLDLRMIWDGYV